VSAALVLGGVAGSVVSAFVPLVNAELLLLALVVAAPASAPLLVVVMAAGQMVGKAVLFVGGERLARGALGGRMARWRLDRYGRLGGPIVALSATVGLPPFYLVAIGGSALGVRLRTFLLLGFAGRVLRFGALVCIPRLTTGVLGS
jgi:membrane protein YqaA with SNARE-associated domain